MAVSIRDEEWWSAEAIANELAEFIAEHAWDRAVSYTVGTQAVERMPAQVRAAVMNYNSAVHRAKQKKRPKR
jgi:hypothetical protein